MRLVKKLFTIEKREKSTVEKIMDYRNKHKRCKTCILAIEDVNKRYWYCRAKNEVGRSRFLKEAGHAGMFCKFYVARSFLREE